MRLEPSWIPIALALSLLQCGVRSDISAEAGEDEIDENRQGERLPEPQMPNPDPKSHRGENDPGKDEDEDEDPALGSRRLAACKLGFEPGQGDCDWLADGLCYDTKEAACDCICPREHDSLCLSGFWGGRDSQTPVHCQ